MNTVDTGPKRRTRGFTLLELMIVVAVLALLAAITLPSYREYVDRGRRAEGKLKNLQDRLGREPSPDEIAATSGVGGDYVTDEELTAQLSSTEREATCRTRSVLSMPAMLMPFTTALISSRKSLRKRSGSR